MLSLIRNYGHLLKRGGTIAATRFRKRVKVALIIEHCPEYATLYYGVLLVGSVVVTLNTAAKEDGLNNWIAHAGTTFGFIKPAVQNCESPEPAKTSLIRCIHEGF